MEILAIHFHTRSLEAYFAGIIGTTIGIALFRWKIPFIALTTIGAGHLVNAVIEAFADSYFTHGAEWSFVLGFVEFVTFFSLLIVFDRKTVRPV